MKLLDKILVAHDFSKSSENVVLTAIGLAKIFHSKISLIHVLPDDIDNEKVKRLLDETATHKLTETVKQISGQGVEIGKSMLKYGSPYDAIIRTAGRERVNLIVIGSGGDLKDAKFQLGTTAHRIIQKSDQPVFVVKEDTPLKVKKMLCPVDFSSNSKRALKNAITMSRRFDAELMVMNVVDLHGAKWFTAEKDSDIEKEKLQKQKEIFDAFLAEFNFADLTWQQEIRLGDPPSEILKAIPENDIDLLVMGTAGKTGLSRLVIGSVTEKAIREVPCSFITIKSTDVIQLQLETIIKDLENHYQIAEQLLADGFFEESIEEFEKCININSMHVPSYYGIAKVCEKLEDHEKAKLFNNRAKEIMDRIWNMKIEKEVRKYIS
ncbi:MAG: universal stress protein [Cyclobacteriaceae bacterium]|nr:universal stress protein [Cyclobacteriaceae bacterium]